LVERKFSAEAIGRETVALYERLMGHERRRSRPASS
jgi:hypothetical protein